MFHSASCYKAKKLSNFIQKWKISLQKRFSGFINSFALRRAKTLWSFGPSKCSRVKEQTLSYKSERHFGKATLSMKAIKEFFSFVKIDGKQEGILKILFLVGM